MGAVVDTLPGRLNINVVSGCEQPHLVDFSIDVTGYTFEAAVYSTVTGAEVAGMTVGEVNLSAGQVNVMPPGGLACGTYAWRLYWTAPGGFDRATVQGFLEVFA